MHLMLATRTDPPLPLTRLRVRDQLTELRATDLRFIPPEVATFLNQVMDLDLSSDDVAALETRTEGWIAGLQLAAIALQSIGSRQSNGSAQSPLSTQGRRDAQDFVRAFSGSHRYVIDYLAEEVLTRQPEHIQKFLLQTSILDRLHGPLCEAILGQKATDTTTQTSNADLSVTPSNKISLPRSSAPPLPRSPAPLPLDPSASGQEILVYLEQANLFLIPLDDERRWYRYHHLFADFLREHLRQNVDEEEIARLHQRAGRWCAANGLTAEAVGHALAAADTEQAIRLIEQMTLPLLTQGESCPTQQFGLDPVLVWAKPGLCSLLWSIWKI
jgi:LuxR family maltose regulon positive regulatory protein